MFNLRLYMYHRDVPSRRCPPIIFNHIGALSYYLHIAIYLGLLRTKGTVFLAPTLVSNVRSAEERQAVLVATKA
jgi:hypothetical protein